MNVFSVIGHESESRFTNVRLVNRFVNKTSEYLISTQNDLIHFVLISELAIMPLCQSKMKYTYSVIKLQTDSCWLYLEEMK